MLYITVLSNNRVNFIFKFLITEYSNKNVRSINYFINAPTDQYRANLYKAWKCPHNNLIGIDPISTDILVYT